MTGSCLPLSSLHDEGLHVQGPNATFVRVLLLRHRLMGAVLIGNTDYEEVFENLILDGLDLSSYGPDLLSSEVDLDQVFD